MIPARAFYVSVADYDTVSKLIPLVSSDPSFFFLSTTYAQQDNVPSTALGKAVGISELILQAEDFLH